MRRATRCMRAPAALEHLLRHRVPPVDSFGRSQRGEAAEAALAAAEDVSPLAQPPHRAHLACCTLRTSALEHLLPPMQPAEPLGRAQRGEAAKATLPAAEAVPSLCDHHAASGAETPPPLNTGCPAKCSTLKPLTKRRGEAAGAALLAVADAVLCTTCMDTTYHAAGGTLHAGTPPPSNI